MDNNSIMVDHARVDLSHEEKCKIVAKATNSEGDWDWKFLRNVLPAHIIGHVPGMEPLTNEDRDDKMIWGPDPKDGSVLQPQGQAASGGILQDWLGRKITVCATNLGLCPIMRAGLRAADIGLKIAWDLG
ncbi:hypothetical protein LINPERPRIM_LOCUS2522 [Linum perenne]